MAGRTTHIIWAAGAWIFFFSFNLAFSAIHLNLFNPSIFLTGALLAIVGGIFPDIIDPPSNPRHRGIGHYGGFIALLLLLVNPLSNDRFEFIIMSFIVGYSTHFAMDIFMKYDEWER